MSTPRLPLLALTAAVLAAALSGCAVSADYPAFDRDQTAADELPDDYSVELDQFDPASARFSGSHEGNDYYLIKGADGADMGGPCLAMVQEDHGGGIACAAGGRVGLRAGTTEAAMAPVGEPAGEAKGWTRISENVAVRDAR